MSETWEIGEKPMQGDIVDRLRGRYPVGPMLKNGEPEFGWRQFDVSTLPPIQGEAASEIEQLRLQRAPGALAEIAKLREALKAYDQLRLVISSAVRIADPEHYEAVMAAIKDGMAALK